MVYDVSMIQLFKFTALLILGFANIVAVLLSVAPLTCTPASILIHSTSQLLMCDGTDWSYVRYVRSDNLKYWQLQASKWVIRFKWNRDLNGNTIPPDYSFGFWGFGLIQSSQYNAAHTCNYPSIKDMTTALKRKKSSPRQIVWTASLPSPLVVLVSGTWSFVMMAHWWRRNRRGFCSGCGYDLTDNISRRCPECGVEICNG